MSEKILVVPSKGLGDALILLTLSHALKCHGCSVTTVHPHLPRLSKWFAQQSLIDTSLSDIDFRSYDHIFLQNDNSSFVNEMKKQRALSQTKALTILYPTYTEKKHGPLHENDIVFNSSLSMVANVENMVRSLTSLELSRSNGIAAPSHLHYRKQFHKVIIHPFSSEEKKNWSTSKFIQFAKEIKSWGFSPHFVMEKPLYEIDRYLHQENIPFSAHLPLTEVAAMIYEAGFVVGNDSFATHLASNLHIPYLVIADSSKRMKLWQPGWGNGKVVTLSSSLHNFHYFKNNWQRFLPLKQVLKSFEKLCRTP